MNRFEALRFAFVFWPIAPFMVWTFYQLTINFVCTSPNLTIYRYCDVKASGSPNGLLFELCLGWFAYSWAYLTHGILPKEDIQQ